MMSAQFVSPGYNKLVTIREFVRPDGEERVYPLVSTCRYLGRSALGVFLVPAYYTENISEYALLITWDVIDTVHEDGTIVCRETKV